MLDTLLYGIAYAIPIAIGVVMAVSAFSDCVTVSLGDESELVCPDGAPSVGLLLGGIGIGLLGTLAVATVYVVGLARSGQTWGKRLVGIKVVRTDNGDVPGMGKALGRELFAAFLSSTFFYLGFLWMLWDNDRQTWHDKVAGTVVIETP